jgi:predicted HNH restriction endonuclease
MDDYAWAQDRNQQRELHPVPNPIRTRATTSNQISQITMAKAKTYLAKIRKQVKADHNGTIPENLELTIENYAQTLELRDVYMEEVKKEPMVVETGSMGQTSRKQNPLCNLLYQQEGLCQTYAKMLGLTAAKAAMKTEPTDNVSEEDPMRKYYMKQ